MVGGVGKALLSFILVLLAFVSINIAPNLAYILAGIAAFILFFFRSRESIILYSAYFVFEDVILLHTPTTFIILLKYLGDILILAAFLATFAKIAMRRYSLEVMKGNYIHIPFILFLLGAAISTMINEVPFFISFVSVRQLLRYVILYYTVLFTAQAEWTEKDMQNVVKILITLFFIQAGIGYLQILLGPNSSLIKTIFLPKPDNVILGDVYVLLAPVLSERSEAGAALMGTMLIANTYGVFMVSGLCLLLGLYTVSTDPVKRFKLLVGMGIMLVPIILTYSRQSIYASLVGVMSIGWIQKNKTFLLLSIGVIAAFYMYSSKVQGVHVWEKPTIPLSQHIISPLHPAYIERYKNTDRIMVATQLIPKFLKSEYVTLGLGPGAFGSAFGFLKGYFEGFKKMDIPKELIYLVNVATADIGFASILMQYGLVGLITFYSMPLFLFWLIRKKELPFLKEPLKQGIAVGFLGYIVALLASNVGYINFGIRQIGFYFWLLAGIISSFRITESVPSEEVMPQTVPLRKGGVVPHVS